MLTEEQKIKLVNSYHKKVIEIMTLDKNSIKRWASKRTITEKVLKPERQNEQSVLDALKDEQGYQMGDKIRVFYLPNGDLKLEKNFDGEYCKVRLLEKLYKVVLIFKQVIDPKLFVNYSLKRSQQKLTELLQNNIEILDKV